MRRAATKKAEGTTEWGRRRLLGILAAAVAVAVLLLVGLVYAVYLAITGIGDEANANTGVATGETERSTVARGAAHRDDIAAEPMLSVPEGAAFPAETTGAKAPEIKIPVGTGINVTAQPLGTLLADTPLTLAETASIFGEGLVFERLLAKASKEERRGLLAGKIEDGINTVVRQIAFHRFETRFHALRQAGELSSEQIGEIWLDEMSKSLGPAIKLNPGYEHYWAYVSHFVHAPFYVYAYAFGDLLVRGLMEKRREDPVKFAPLYEELLAAGGTKTYVEALAPFGLNPREKAFWSAGMKQLERLVDEFEALV